MDLTGLDIRERGAIVTGGGSGLGAATARALAERGAKVALLDVNLEGATAVAAETGGLAIACDVSDAASAEAAVAEASAAHGSPAVLVNCAGIAPAKRIVGRDGPMDLADFKKVIDVNLVGTFNMIRLAGAAMGGNTPDGEGQRGVIVSTASVAAFEGQIGQAAYSASKGGVHSLTLVAAREFARTCIRVCAVAPGIFGTPMLLGMPQEVQDSLAAQVPFPPRLGKPEEFARMVLSIIDNPMLNGETIRLDGAIRMGAK
jgi:NAD(P)-dependent dehydrogenase (short-subunit alcohol dehydrogenase family)